MLHSLNFDRHNSSSNRTCRLIRRIDFSGGLAFTGLCWSLLVSCIHWYSLVVSGSLPSGFSKMISLNHFGKMIPLNFKL